MTSSDINRWQSIADWTSNRPGASLSIHLILVAGLLLLGYLNSDESLIDSDMLSLALPAESASAQGIAIRQLRSTAERRQTWVISHADQATAKVTAEAVKGKLSVSPLYEEPQAVVDPATLLSFYEPYRLGLADDAGLKKAREYPPEKYVEEVVRTLFRTSTLPGTDLAADPFLLQAGFISDLVSTPPPFAIDGSMLSGRVEDQWTFLIPVMLNASAFDLGLDEEFDTLQDDMRKLATRHGAVVRSVGAVDFAMANRALAVSEIRLIGGTALALVAALLLLTFHNVKPFLIVGLVLVSALAGGFAACLFIFESVHIMTLIAGSSLIGISVDYAFHLLADGYRETPDGDRWSASKGRASVFSAVSLGLLTSLLGFSGLYASGFEGLQQIAAFSGAGLLFAWLGLLLGAPALLKDWRPGTANPAGLRLAAKWTRFYRPGRRALLLLTAISGIGFVLFPSLGVNNDIRLLTARTPDIDRLMALSASLSSQLLDSRFLLVQAEDTEQMLQREEQLRPLLRNLVDAGAISHFAQISQFIPSETRQSTVFSVNQSLMNSPGKALDQLQIRISLRESAAEELRQAITSAETDRRVLGFQEFIESPLGRLSENLYLGSINGLASSITTLAGVTDLAEIQDAAGKIPGVTLVDNVSAISDSFGSYVDNARLGLFVAFLLVTGLMMWRFGLVDGMLTMLVPLNTFLITLLSLHLLGERLNLFHIVALTLVLGMGMDYTIFLKQGKRRVETMLAVLLAVVTTECAFGLIGASRVGAMHSFGVTVAIGTLVSFLIAPMVARTDEALQK